MARRSPKPKTSDLDPAKERLLNAAEVSDSSLDPINFKPAGGNLKHSPNSSTARKETV